MERLTEKRNPVAIALLSLALFACVGGSVFRGEPHEWWADRGPVVPHETFPASCDLCHTGSDWNTLREDFEYDHLAETGVALEGAHARAECLRCHNDRGPVADFAARGCRGCHEDVHEGFQGERCDTCHDPTSWRVLGAIEDHARTRFPLVGAHAATSCRRCHEGIEAGILAPLDIECISCHADDLARALVPDHAGNGWTSRCDRCHIPTAWTGAAFNHSTYPLTGAHLRTDCVLCHVGNVYAGTPRDCVDCHLAEYQATTQPPHAASGFPTTCYSCHSTVSWFGANFDHTFRINGGPHGAFLCTECHQVPSNFSIISCTHCHEHRESESNSEHERVNGYVWSSPACVSCHPTGD